MFIVETKMAQDKAVFDILPIVVKKGLLNETVSAIDIFDLDFFESRINALKVAFPEEFCCHTLALKANPIRGVVQFAIKHGLGGEAASICETLHALSLGIEPCKVIFDSPCKTRSDLRQAMLHGVQINLDNDLELELVDELLKEVGETNSSFGLRVNPGVGSGSLAFTSTATKNSKFGHPIFGDKKRQVIELFHKYKWLSGIHVHVGSQGVPMTLFQAGAQVCMDFVQDLESEGIKIKTVNIGGGLTSSYEHAEDSTEFTFANYRKILESSIPQLFSGRYQVVTEFGRSLLLKAGTTLSKVELVKQWIPENVPIVMAHVGANQFFTEVYLPQTRKHRFDLVDEQGMPKDTRYDQNIQQLLMFSDHEHQNTTNIKSRRTSTVAEH